MDQAERDEAMTTEPTQRVVVVRGTEVLPGDDRQRYREKIARITLDSMVQFVGLLDAAGKVLEINKVALDAVGVRLAVAQPRVVAAFSARRTGDAPVRAEDRPAADPGRTPRPAAPSVARR